MQSLFLCQRVSATLLNPSELSIHRFLPQARTHFQSANSISTHGLLYLPFAIRAEDATSYELVTGYNCAIQAIENHNLDSIDCRVLSSQLSTDSILRLIYDEIGNHKPLSPIEEAFFLELCEKKLTRVERTECYQRTGIKSSQHSIQRKLDLLQLEQEIQLAIHDGIISEAIGRELCQLSQVDSLCFYRLIDQLGFGGGKQKRLLSLLRDLSGRNGKTFQEILAFPEIQQVIENSEMNPPQKGQQLLNHLQQIHSPLLNEAQRTFNRWGASLNLPNHWKVQPSQSFEQDKVQLIMDFDSPTQLEEFVRNSTKK